MARAASLPIALPNPLARALKSVSARIDSQACLLGRKAIIAKLEALSDQELADFGLSRKSIPQYVFRDIYYV